MSASRWLDLSERWFRLLLRLYPPDFRDDVGQAMVEAYRDRAREALTCGGVVALASVCLRALADAATSGPGERTRPAEAWRRGGTWRDAGMAARRLMRSPALVAAMVGTLMVGLGTFAIVFTAAQKILVAPLPYERPDDLYFVWRDYRPVLDLNRGWLAGTDVAALQQAGGVVRDAVGLMRTRTTFAAREDTSPTEIVLMSTTPNLFEVLGVGPRLGRGFLPGEAGPGRPPLIVLTHDLWNRLGADPSIVGTDVRLNGRPFTVIGVLPPAFAFMMHASLGPPQRADAYITHAVDLAGTDPGSGSYAGLIRVAPGTSPEAAGAAVDAVGRLVDARDFKSRGLKLYPVGAKPDLVAAVRPALQVLVFAGASLVVVLMVNLASVLLARAAEREHELAVSRALGANAAVIVRTTLFEGAWLGLLGGAAAAVAAYWGTRALIALAPLDLPRRETVALDWPIAGTVVMLGGVLGMAAAVVPAAWAVKASMPSLLAASAVRGGVGQGRLRRGLVVAQIALTLTLLAAGGLVVRSFERLLRVDPGFTSSGILTLRVPMPAQLVPEVDDALAVQQRIEDELRSLPGVGGVGAVDVLPLSAAASQMTISIPGAPGNTGDANRDMPLVDRLGARAGYLEVMGIRLLAGRGFDRARQPGVREALVDRQVAEQFFPSGHALGATIPMRDQTPLTIVGVFEQARLYDVHRDGRPQVIVRAEDWGFRTLSFVVRTTRDPPALIPEVRSAVNRIDARLAVSEVRPMEELVSDSLRQPRVSAVLIAGFALGALLLAGVGLFGVVAASVNRRRRELAVRMALGADHRQALRLVLAEGAALVALGTLIGAPFVYVAGTLVRSVLVGVSPADPLTLGLVALGLASVSLAACYVPARRVLRIDPAQSLRL